jgi:PKD repeat protein/C1A family cysteine protease
MKSPQIGPLRARIDNAFIIVIVLLILLSSVPTPVVSGQASKASDRPGLDRSIDPEALAYDPASEACGLGYVPPALDMSYLEGMAISDGPEIVLYSLVKDGSLPSSYMTQVSAVKSQSNFGTCWAFTTYGSLESTLLVGGDTTAWDFSEKNLVNRAGFDAVSPYGVENTGGNQFMSTAYLVRWDGPVLESDDPYPTGTWSASAGNYTVQKHVQNVYFIPGISGTPPDLTDIKNALMDYGAVYTSINTSAKSGIPFTWNYNPAHYAYYNPNSANLTDHAVTIVGWDDNFLAGNFTPAAPGNGAFIVKNSWGTSWGNNGYFYVSYYDGKIGKSNAVFIAEPVAGHIYQYDDLGLVGWSGYYYGNGTPVETNWLANVFQSNGAEKVTDVSFYARYPGMQYTIYIYTDPASGNPASGSPGTSQSGTLTWPGYNTITLNDPVSVSAGQQFSAVIRITNPAGSLHNYSIPLCYASTYSLTSSAEGEPGVGYTSGNGISWSDVTTAFDDTTTVCLKAFTVDDVALPSVKFHASSYTVNETSGTITLTVDKTGTTGDIVTVNYATANGTALSGINYQAKSGTLTFQPSDTSKIVTINILNDGAVSAQKYFTVGLSSPVNADMSAPSSAQVFVNNTNVMANFSASITAGISPLTVQFNDTSSGPVTGWQWDFGDGTGNSSVRNASHTFTNAGPGSKTFNVTLTVYNSADTSTKKIVNYITVNPPLPGANFTSNLTIGTTLLAVQFTDTSTGTVSGWQWNFGDGSANATVKNPIHTFSNGGAANATYNVTLTITNAGGNSTKKVVNYITVMPLKPAANFSANVTAGDAPLSIQFSDTSAGGPANAWRWSFGDGTANSTAKNPVHRYNSAGNYTVTFTAYNAGGNSTITRVNYVNVTGVGLLTHNYSLVADWNLISVPLDVPDNSINGFFPESVRNEIVDLWGWNASAQKWTYYSPDPNTPFTGYELITTMGAGKAYWVNMNHSASFSISGSIPQGTPNSTISLVSDWNFVGLTGLDPESSGVMYPASWDVWGWNASAQKWTYYSPDPNTPFKGYELLETVRPGQGQWVNM